jgi:hypothetical protein
VPASTQPGSDCPGFEKEEMVDVMIFAMFIASAVSLIVISPRHAQREVLRALRDDSETDSYPRS